MRSKQISQTPENRSHSLAYPSSRAIDSPTMTVNSPTTGALRNINNSSIPLLQTVGVISSVMVASTAARVYLGLVSQLFYEGRVLAVDSRHVITFFLFGLFLSALNTLAISYGVGMLARRRVIAPGLIVANIIASLSWRLWIAPALFERNPDLSSPTTWLVGLFSLVTGTTLQIVLANHVARQQGRD